MRASTNERAAGLPSGALAVTRHLVMHGPTTRGDLGHELSLSSASISRFARRLVDVGMVIEDVAPDQGLGRPRQTLSVSAAARHTVGVKLTADTAYAVGCDLFGTVLTTSSEPLPGAGVDGRVPVDGTLKAISRLVKRVARRLPTLDAVGISLGGPVEDHRVVLEATFLGWRDVDLAGEAAPLLSVPVTVSNDVTALAREQLWFGAGRTHSTFGVLTVGAGIGVGLVREGRVVDRLVDNGHLLVHSPLDASGPICAMGHRGCVAAYLDRDGLERRATRRLRRPVTFADLVTGRDSGHAAFAELLDDASRALGHLVATFAGGLQTEHVVLAGEDVEHLAGTAMHDTIADRVRPGPDESQRTSIVVSAQPLDFTRWARGAAVVAIQDSLGALNSA